MSKEEYYSKIKKIIYRKFDELEVVKRNRGNNLYLRYKNEEYAQIRINKKSDFVYYSYTLSDKICKIFQLEKRDFEIILRAWIEDTFKIKQILIQRCNVLLSSTLYIPLK
jgi:hypothetical protein